MEEEGIALQEDQEVCLYCSDDREVLDPGKRIELLCGHWSHTSCFLQRFMDFRMYTVDCYRCGRGICHTLPENRGVTRGPTVGTVKESLQENPQVQIELCALARLYTDFVKKNSAYTKKLRPIVAEWKTITTPHVEALRSYKQQFLREATELPEKRQKTMAYRAATRMMTYIERTYDLTPEIVRILSTLKIRNRSMRFLTFMRSWRFRRINHSYHLLRAFRHRI